MPSRPPAPEHRFALCSFKVHPGEFTGEETVEYLNTYLPRNYTVLWASTDDTGQCKGLIAGQDDAGWTLDDYVIPRLATGQITTVELTANDPNP